MIPRFMNPRFMFPRPRSARRLRSLALAAALLAAAPPSATAAEGETARVVALGGSVTEILYALGLDDRIVAVDTTSLYPPEAKAEHPDVGYLRALSAEGVLSVGPSLIIAEADAGPAEAVSLLEQASVPFLKAPAVHDPAGVAGKIAFVAKAMGEEAKGRALAEAVTADLDTITGATAGIENRARVLFVLSAAGGRIMAAGEGTSADTMIRLAGAANAVSGFGGYKPLNDEAILAAAPEVVVMMAQGPAADDRGEVLSLPALKQTPAGRDGRLVTMDGLYLLGFGPRTAHAIRDLAHAIYPDRSLPSLPERPWTAARAEAPAQ